MKKRTVLNNQHGLSLMETLTALLIFALLSLFLSTAVVSALDAPKKAEISTDLKRYEQASTLLLEELESTADPSFIIQELNTELEGGLKFTNTKSTKKTAYNNPYYLLVDKTSDQTAIIIETEGKSAEDYYRLVVLKEGSQVEVCTKGLGKKDKELKLLSSNLCTISVAIPVIDQQTTVPPGYIGIYNDVDLNNVRNNLNANYIVMADIDLSNSPFNTDSNGWEPLGSTSVHFEGIFDGNNHTISNLRMNRTTNNYTGLFVSADSALIKDLNLSDVAIGSNWQYGVLFSSSTNSTLDNISVDGVLSTTTESYSVGGLIGDSNGDTISNSDTDITILNPTSHGSLGGLLGRSTDTIISDSHSKVSVPSGTWVGGIVGNATRTTITNTTTDVALEGDYTGGLVGLSTLGTITSSSTEGSIRNANQGAGLVGRDTSGIIQNSTSSVSVHGINAGGLIGSSIDSILSNVSSSGTITTTSSSSYAGGIIAFASKSTVNSIKTLADAHSTSELITMGKTGGILGASNSSNIIIDNSVFTGEITSSGSYTGGIAGTMQGQISNSHSTGAISATNTFTGGLVGSLKGTMDNSYYTGDIVSTSTGVGGLTGSLQSDSIISNSFSSGSVRGLNDVGGLTGYNSGTIRSSYATSTVTGTNNIGGLVGYNANIIESSYANNPVNGVAQVGGLVGNADSSSTINKTFALGSVTGTTSIGGLVGSAPFGGSINQSYARGDVTNTGSGIRTGGLIGNSGTVITQTYSTGKVTSGGTNVGGLAGTKGMFSTITSSYYDRTTSTKTDSTKGTPKTTNEMYQQVTYVGWDFVNVWQIEEGSSYPTLR